MGSGQPVFGNLQEVEIILSANTIPVEEIHRFVMEQGELLPNVDARGWCIGKGGKVWRPKGVIGLVASDVKSIITVVYVPNDQCLVFFRRQQVHTFYLILN